MYSALADWIWVPLLQRELNKYIEQANDADVRFQAEKEGPSGCSMNFAYQRPERFGGVDQKIQFDAIDLRSRRMNHPGAEAIKFYPDWVDPIATEIYEGINAPERNLTSTWVIFAHMRDDFSRRVSHRRAGKHSLRFSFGYAYLTPAVPLQNFSIDRIPTYSSSSLLCARSFIISFLRVLMGLVLTVPQLVWTRRARGH